MSQVFVWLLFWRQEPAMSCLDWQTLLTRLLYGALGGLLLLVPYLLIRRGYSAALTGAALCRCRSSLPSADL
jgi:hypothetical protein